MKKIEDVTIERILFNDDGQVTAVDLHDEDRGEAIFFDKGVAHFHGKYGNAELAKEDKTDGEMNIGELNET